MNIFDYLLENSSTLEKDLVLGPKETKSYPNIFSEILNLANYLKNKFGENNNIILINHNSVYVITCYLAIMKSGNVCVPLNPAIEKENLDFIVKETGSSIAFIPDNLASKYSLQNIKIIDDKAFNDAKNNTFEDPDRIIGDFDKERLAQILFTSGSTGKPKGVMLSHKNLIANTESIIKYLKLTSDDIIEIVLPFYYCYGLSLLHTHLRVGGSVVLNNTFMFLGSVFSDLKKYKCTGFSGVPSHFQILLRKSKSFTKTDYPDLRYVTQAGGKLHNVFIQEFVEAFPEKKFYVMYGQTEATARLSYLPAEQVLEKIGSIGKGIPNVILDIFDETDNPVEVGVVGEIVARGENVMPGYLNAPEENKLTLRNGWLHTGDMAKKDEDGFIYLVARKKEIIKVGGKRISPKEIEEVIVSVPEVVDCTIEGVDDELLGEAIKAIVVLQDGTNEQHGKHVILSSCGKNLALYKVPQIIEFRKRIAVNDSGKKVAK